MMKKPLPTLLIVIAAAGAGFGIAKLTERPAPEPSASAASAPGPTTLKVDAAEIAAAGIAIESATAGNLGAEIIAPATATAAPNGEAILTAHAAGTVTKLTKRIGDAVDADEVLATVESRDAAAMAADRSAADAKLAQARKAAAREQSLFDQHVSPRQDLEAAQAELAAAEAEARRARNAADAAHVSSDGRSISVVSPIAGRVTSQSATLGAFVAPETELFRVSDPRLVQVAVQVTVADAHRLSPGDPAELTLAAGQILTAKVRSVAPALDPQTRTATVLLTLDEQQPAALTPGQTLQALITPKSAASSGVVVPEDAIQIIDGRDAVFVRTEAGFDVVNVAVASRSGGRASIASGLRAGQKIAARNAFLLKAELGKGSGEDE